MKIVPLPRPANRTGPAITLSDWADHNRPAFGCAPCNFRLDKIVVRVWQDTGKAPEVRLEFAASYSVLCLIGATGTAYEYVYVNPEDSNLILGSMECFSIKVGVRSTVKLVGQYLGE